MTNDRIHRYLDGELPLEELRPQERLEALRYESSIRDVVDGHDGSPGLDLAPVVMRRLTELEASERAAAEAARAGWPRRLVARLWSPRTVTVHLRPAVTAAAFVAVVGFALLAALRSAAPAVPLADAPARVFVQFRLDLATARSVTLAGDFTAWRPDYELHETEPGVWSVTVPLEPGVHDYAFIVDGERWVPDTLAAPATRWQAKRCPSSRSARTGSGSRREPARPTTAPVSKARPARARSGWATRSSKRRRRRTSR